MRGDGHRSKVGTLGHEGEQGYMLLGLIVAIFLILLALSVAASDMAQTIRREKERESARRADQYIRAIRRYYLKTGSYPPTIKALENTNMIRYLRQQYKDPLTGKDFRMIVVGQNKTTPKGFFGQPLGGLATTGLGAAAGMQSAMPGAPGASGATTPTTGAAGPSASTGVGSANPLGLSSPMGGSGSLGSAAGMQSAGMGGSGAMGPFMGVGTDAKGNSVLVVNGEDTYEMWEFLYDPRVEKLRAAAALNAGVGSSSLGSLGGQVPGASGSGTNQTSPTNSMFPSSSIGPGGNAAPTGTSPNGP